MCSATPMSEAANRAAKKVRFLCFVAGVLDNRFPSTQ
jgi:hypothetical protein